MLHGFQHPLYDEQSETDSNPGSEAVPEALFVLRQGSLKLNWGRFYTCSDVLPIEPKGELNIVMS